MSNIPTNQSCATCRFWTGARAADAGQCRRFPPTTAGNAVMNVPGNIANPRGGVAPVPIYSVAETAGGHWCGEWAHAKISDTLALTPDRLVKGELK